MRALSQALKENITLSSLYLFCAARKDAFHIMWTFTGSMQITLLEPKEAEH